MAETKTVKPTSITIIEKRLRYIAAVIKEKGREALKEYDLSPPQFVALQWISDQEGMTIGELSTRMYLAFSTTTDLIDRMEKKELVKRTRDEQDKRVVRIHLLPQGEKLIETVIKKRQTYLADKLSFLTDDQLWSLRENLDEIYKHIQHEF
ncbi:DNA-binding MarR family transcriptional regulator [Scopulibacillus darangshiensis]|uniref:DNA-binding MarR family transcriptional regulator n=1 Tax=Scopulibacillus darangshiensis TaxID=442528 RepID=A0A4R2PAX0_9BACL|nr:MarR family transcriptional regulator [Scopulibacillus darangshiensis]TCP32142.1 DNA-binding MarR family transcriptional regulator [Scopulibacillus darangshiensis]